MLLNDTYRQTRLITRCFQIYLFLLCIMMRITALIFIMQRVFVVMPPALQYSKYLFLLQGIGSFILMRAEGSAFHVFLPTNLLYNSPDIFRDLTCTVSLIQTQPCEVHLEQVIYPLYSSNFSKMKAVFLCILRVL